MADIKISDIIAPAYYPMHAAIRCGLYDEYWLDGGRGSAKSSFIALEIILGMMRNPDANAIVYRKVGATLRESVLEQLLWAIDKLGVSAYWKARVSPMEVRYLPTGQRILFRGLDDASKSKSLKMRKGYFGYLWFEELAEMHGMEEIRTVKASINRGTPEEGRAITFYSYNPPKSASNWVNKEAITPRKGRLRHHSCYLDIPPAWLGRVFIAEAEALKASNEMAYRHMYLGEVTGTGGNVFDNIQLRSISAEELNGQAYFFNGLDFGFAVDPDAFIRWAYDKRKKQLIAVSEYYAARTPTDRLAEEVKRRAERGAVRCDSADPRMINELRSRSINALGVKKGPGSVEHGIRWLQELNAIIIDPQRTPNAAREFKAYEYTQDKNGGFLPEYPDKDNHLIDATRYALEQEIGMKKLKTISKSALGF